MHHSVLFEQIGHTFHAGAADKTGAWGLQQNARTSQPAAVNDTAANATPGRMHAWH